MHHVYRRNVSAVYAFFGYSVDADTAEELTAATFERVVRSWRRFDPSRATVTAWILVIARNILRDHFRRQRHRAGPSLDQHPALVINLAAADDGLQHWLSMDAVKGWLESLNPTERDVLGLRYGGDLSTDEIAGTLGLSHANVHQITSRALRRLRENAAASRVSDNGSEARKRPRRGNPAGADRSFPPQTPAGVRSASS